MTDYHSVINTAKNGKLIRAEIREYVLGMALRYGFFNDFQTAARLYPENTHRINQCTFLQLELHPKLDIAVSQFGNDLITFMPDFLIQTIASYFKVYINDDETIVFYDTKKFRIYYKRLAYGPDKKIRLNHTIQYIWTNYLAMLFCLYGEHTYGPGWCSIDIRHFDMYANRVTPHDMHATETRKQPEDIDRYIRSYLADIVHVKCHVVAGVLFFEDHNAYQAFWDIANTEAIRIYEKLEEGGYLDENRHKKYDGRRKTEGDQVDDPDN